MIGFQGEEFLEEIPRLSLLHHPNILKLMGWCVEGGDHLLVHEFMPSGSLDYHLHGLPSNKEPLDWNTRIKIAVGVAKGMDYLHNEAKPPVIFGELRPSNILLDKDFHPKLVDFGFAKFCRVGDSIDVPVKGRGSCGYCAPEYASTGKSTPKSDTYSFGIVLLEIISGFKPDNVVRPTGKTSLAEWVQPVLEPREPRSAFADPKLDGKFCKSDLQKIVELAAMCVRRDPDSRPSMHEVACVMGLIFRNLHIESSWIVGQMLLELHSLQVVLAKSGGACSEVYGGVKVRDVLGAYDIFKAEKEGSTTLITCDGLLPLTDAHRCVIGLGSAVGVSLKEKHLDREVTNGYLFVGPNAPIDKNRPMSAFIEGDHGYSMLHFSLFDYAVQATVEFLLFADSEKLPYTIHGEVFAEYSSYEYDGEYARKYHRTALSSVPPNKALVLGQDGEPIEVKRALKEFKIPLSRSVVAVPSWWLVIRGNLRIHMEIGSQETSTPVVAYFAAEAGGTTTRALEGIYGRIEIKITWIDSVYSYYRDKKAKDK